MQRRFIPLIALGLSACYSGGGYTRAEVIYAEPVDYVYVMPVDRVVYVSRDVLVSHGYTVYRVETSGPNRVIWARRAGGDEVVRIFVTPHQQRVQLRGVLEVRSDNGKHKGWQRRGPPQRVMADIDGRLRRR